MLGDLLGQLALLPSLHVRQQEPALLPADEIGFVQAHVQRLLHILFLMADKLLHGPQPLDLLVDLSLLLVHHFQKKPRGTLLHVGLDLTQGHAKALQRPDHFKGVHLPHKIIPVPIFLLHRR